MAQQSSLGELQPIVGRGPKVEVPHAGLITAPAIPGTIAASSNYTSPLIPADGFYDFTIGVTLSNNGPQPWLADVLARIAAHPAHRLDELLPWNWTSLTATFSAGAA